MDQHPIPQDVTGFQFKLIGTMTVKQFGYVAVGVITAVIVYYLPLSGFGILIKVLLVPLFGASGVIVAFVPIDGRSIDVMATNFAKALFSPNQYIYHRQGRKMSFSTVTVMKPAAIAKAGQAETLNKGVTKQAEQKQEKLRAFLMSSQGRVKNELDKKEASYINAFALPAMPNSATPSVVVSPVQQSAALQKPTPAPPKLTTTSTPPVQQMKAAIQTPAQVPQMIEAVPDNAEALVKKEQQLAQELAQEQLEEAKSLPLLDHDAAHQRVATLASQIASVHAQKQQLEHELTRLQTQLTEQKSTSVPSVEPISPPKPIVPMQDPRLVKIVPKETVKRAEAPQVSDTPNVVVGIVKDARGNVLSNILVEVKDKTGNPVRAFKTNLLGQFASATPLTPGVYTMELEDPKNQHNFDVLQITANNEIMRPIEIISHDAREALRQQLFS